MTCNSILMCAPEFFHVDYEINPWMTGNIQQVNPQLAKEQWLHLFNCIKIHAEVKLMDPQNGLPDLVFTANAALVYKDKAIISKFKPKERKGEERHFQDWFEDNGYQTYTTGESEFEGAGDALFDRGTERLWAAYGFRSSRESHRKIADILGVDVVSLNLIDPRFYHLDTCFCPLESGYLMYYPGAFSLESQETIRRSIAPEKLIIVSEDDAKNFALNAINIGSHIIMNKSSENLRRKLDEKGFKVLEAPMSEFMKSGGSTKCLTLRLNEA